MQLKDVTQWLDNYLAINECRDDSSYNGLQVEGKDDVKSILFTTDAGLSLFKKAVAEAVDMIVVHHGMFWKWFNPSICASTKERVKLLLDNGISLYAAHLPLDKHPIVGNNAQLISLLGFEKDRPFAMHKGQYISFIGKSSVAYSIQDIARKLEANLQTKCIVLPYGAQDIKSIAVCSGGAGYEHLAQAMEARVDLYISGEAFECFHTVTDAQFNVILAGHHATETVGVKALASVVRDALTIKTIYWDEPTGF